ncbi:MAG TPA: hypothetical protein VM733_04640 [Thermoanaerobaculia bacterium]|nr:hypothetical protein [Thermoanaerobaculia bacterium]
MPGLAPSISPRCDVVRRDALTRRDRDAMFALYTAYFATADRVTFERDLAEKEWVILLCDDDGAIAGFSTLMRLHFGGATVFFSGDTIVAKHRWGTFDLPRLWAQHVFAHAGANTYWFLISSGWRTYRYLPLFFREFHPRDAGMKPLLDRIAIAKFGDAYDARTGVIRLATPAPLREGVSDPDARMSNPHVRFFVEANPGHADGDELACLVRVGVDNLTPAGLRMIGRR